MAGYASLSYPSQILVVLPQCDPSCQNLQTQTDIRFFIELSYWKVNLEVSQWKEILLLLQDPVSTPEAHS